MSDWYRLYADLFLCSCIWNALCIFLECKILIIGNEDIIPMESVTLRGTSNFQTWIHILYYSRRAKYWFQGGKSGLLYHLLAVDNIHTGSPLSCICVHVPHGNTVYNLYQLLGHSVEMNCIQNVLWNEIWYWSSFINGNPSWPHWGAHSTNLLFVLNWGFDICWYGVSWS